MNEPARRGPKSAAPQKRAEIVAITAKMLNEEQGDHVVNMNDIAQAAGIAKPTLYHYFKSKEEIIFSIHMTLFELMRDQLEERLATESQPEDQLRGVFRDIFAQLHSHPGHTRVFREYFRRLSPERQKIVREQEGEYERSVRKILTDGVEQGVFKDLDPTLASLALFGMAYWAYEWYNPDGRIPAQDLADQFYTYFVSGIGAR
ncbi:TetR/AcrR family transcriptional regulator [Nocardioides currus]|uniref:TetR/AcrR family transcriptional regulator n=1 Tax=Nocardioides currus TaxID=2133958 RepID=A0A2R7Z2F5_9ACTN|nr:TetR/AcrR family transcriptional regulator [Nocardioides currus]PUA82811.1 TetR/AcrR family transcriptional regulator [Nocardioides currus]